MGRRHGQHDGPASQRPPSWSRNDHEDGGPTIQLPAAEAAAPFQRLTAIQYIRAFSFAGAPARTEGFADEAHAKQLVIRHYGDAYLAASPHRIVNADDAIAPRMGRRFGRNRESSTAIRRPSAHRSAPLGIPARAARYKRGHTPPSWSLHTRGAARHVSSSCRPPRRNRASTARPGSPSSGSPRRRPSRPERRDRGKRS